MSASSELQTAIYAALVADSGVSALVGSRIYDPPPSGAVFPYISFGPTDAVEADTFCLTGRVETVQVDVWSRSEAGSLECKAIVDAIKAALHDSPPTLTEAACATMIVTQTRVFRDEDGITTHGVVVVEADIEEP